MSDGRLQHIEEILLDMESQNTLLYTSLMTDRITLEELKKEVKNNVKTASSRILAYIDTV